MKNINEIQLKPGILTYTDVSKAKEKVKKNYVMIVLFLLPIIAFIISLTLGRYGIPLSDLMTIFTGKLFNLPVTLPETVETVLFQVRIPRIIAAMLVGAALATAGATYQGLFKNPMISPDILGASAGAGFGAAVGILMSFGVVGIQFSAFLVGLGAVILTYTIATIIARGNNAILVLVLTGMVVSTLFSSFISITKYVADPDSKLPAITFWLMGGLSSVGTRDIMILLMPLALGIIPIMLLRWKLNVLSFGEEEAQAMGIDTRKIRIIVIICSTLLTASAVSISGMIGWVGLIIPHIARLIVGPNYKVLLPASMLIGSTFLLLVDDVARSAFVMEIPLGILTAIIGAPIFIYLLLKGRRGWI
ncbi:iron ABC transporter permease [Clostridium sp. DJ247]|uniref:FecCD family ABC transporter permease n=1 Tax=Clostridium sp. DJ247 TaxID=2726188 RepID=UPI0016239143|nr:iron ABC transporter permease [Clostridium sp. DJ247]MBC2582692.1 iron ABC transporter permease [Clostridium sp. DJ247]